MKMPFRLPRPLIVAAFWCCLAAVTWLALRPANFPPTSHGDKVAHVVAFAVLGALALGAWPTRTAPVFWWLVAYGVALEIAQGVTSHRTADGLDVVANVGGLAVAVASSMALQRLRSGKAGPPGEVLGAEDRGR